MASEVIGSFIYFLLKMTAWHLTFMHPCFKTLEHHIV